MKQPAVSHRRVHVFLLRLLQSVQTAEFNYPSDPIPFAVRIKTKHDDAGQMTTELQAHSKALEEHTTKTARDVAILKDKDQEYARQGQAKSKEVSIFDNTLLKRNDANNIVGRYSHSRYISSFDDGGQRHVEVNRTLGGQQGG